MRVKGELLVAIVGLQVRVTIVQELVTTTALLVWVIRVVVLLLLGVRAVVLGVLGIAV